MPRTWAAWYVWTRPAADRASSQRAARWPRPLSGSARLVTWRSLSQGRTKAMRLTLLGNRLTRVALAAAFACSLGCRRTPYINQTKEVPHEVLGTIPEVDREVKKANFVSQSPVPLPQISKPRTTENPEASEVWYLTLPDAIRIALDHAEVVRV